MSTTPATIVKDTVVTFRYKLTDPDGKVLDESDESGMDYLHGGENIVPGLEKQMEGRAPGDRFRAQVSPEDGYGLGDEETQVIPRSSFPDDLEVEEGMQLFAEGTDGETIPIWVVAVRGDEVEVDPNHPLAGILLTFDVEVVSIRPASSEELEHGHPHGPDGHHH